MVTFYREKRVEGIDIENEILYDGRLPPMYRVRGTNYWSDRVISNPKMK